MLAAAARLGDARAIKILFHYHCRPALLVRLARLGEEGIEVETCPEPDEALFDRMIPRAQVLRHVLKPAGAAMGARLLYHAPSRKHDVRAEWRDLNSLLEQSDIVSLHLPLTSDGERMIDAGALGRMKPGAILINTARGGLVDETALLAALKSGRLAGAGLDVFGEEPLDPASPLPSLANVVLSPHLAWLAPETIERSIVVAAENCRRLARGEPLLHRVV